jgi:hypothetical protein
VLDPSSQSGHLTQGQLLAMLSLVTEESEHWTPQRLAEHFQLSENYVKLLLKHLHLPPVYQIESKTTEAVPGYFFPAHHLLLFSCHSFFVYRF